MLDSQGGTMAPNDVHGLGLSAESKDDQAMSEQAEKFMRRSQSAVELRSLASLPRSHSEVDLREQEESALAELTTPEGHTYKVGRLSNEERAQKILKYRQKRHERNFNKRIKYQCRKTLADSRPRVRGRFARNDDAGAVMPHETKKALAEKAKKEKQETSSAQPTKAVAPPAQPFKPSSQGPGQMSFVPLSRPPAAVRSHWPSTSSTPSPFIPASAPNWPSQPTQTFIPTSHGPPMSAPIRQSLPSISPQPIPHSMHPLGHTHSRSQSQDGGMGHQQQQQQVSATGPMGSSMPMLMGRGGQASGHPNGVAPRHIFPARPMPQQEPPRGHQSGFPYLPASGMWTSTPAGDYDPHDQLLDQLDQQLDQQLPLAADGTQAYDSGNLGFMPFDL
ncbi:hypothetical protein WJX84_010512 [Apatococcus fuscideae]|uniref:CCT domain-containing protein n=1 Tax=Apatococcus fuscideae TaxID=2026836 RepID=A0AAW1T0T2_9CHLO